MHSVINSFILSLFTVELYLFENCVSSARRKIRRHLVSSKSLKKSHFGKADCCRNRVYVHVHVLVFMKM